MIAIAGAGAFGTALAVALGREGRAVTLWARDVGEMAERRQNAMTTTTASTAAAAASRERDLRMGENS